MVYTNQLEYQVVRNLDRIILNIDQIVKRAHWTIVEEGNYHYLGNCYNLNSSARVKVEPYIG